MTTKLIGLISIVLISFLVTWTDRDYIATDEDAVRQAVLDYVEGVYEVDPTRIERSVHPDLAKTGFHRRQGQTGYTQGRMSYEALLDVAKSYNKEKKLPPDAPKKIEIYEVLDQTASIKLTAYWGIDYMHLAKIDGKWMIVNVMWQSDPVKE